MHVIVVDVVALQFRVGDCTWRLVALRKVYYDIHNEEVYVHLWINSGGSEPRVCCLRVLNSKREAETRWCALPCLCTP